MSGAVARVLEQAESLTVDEKSELIHKLVEPKNHEMTPNIEDAWLDEVERRSEEVKSGKVELIPFSKLKEEFGWQ